MIVNGAECEPYLTSDYRVMMEEPEKVVAGLKVMLQLFDNAKGVIAIENNKPEAIKKMKDLVKDEPRIEVCELLTKYPQGGERTLIYAVTGRKVNSSMLPGRRWLYRRQRRYRMRDLHGSMQDHSSDAAYCDCNW